jgi:hypothetical protein
MVASRLARSENMEGAASPVAHLHGVPVARSVVSAISSPHGTRGNGVFKKQQQPHRSAREWIHAKLELRST